MIWGGGGMAQYILEGRLHEIFYYITNYFTLHENVHNSGKLGEEYSISIRDRKKPDTRDGILLVIKNTLNSTSVFKRNENEILGCHLLHGSAICYLLCYIPPAYSASGFVVSHLTSACKKNI